MKLFITLISSLFIYDLYAQDEIIQEKAVEALRKTDIAKRLEDKINHKIQKIPQKELTLKTLAVGQVLANKRIDLRINNNSNVNLDYEREQVVYSFQIKF